MPNYPKDCGKRFAHLIQTPDGKRGINKPCGLFCWETDLLTAQKRVQDDVAPLVNKAWKRLLDIEGGDAPQVYGQPMALTPIADKWRAEVTAWQLEVNDLSKFDILDPLGLEGHINTRWALASQGACLIDALDREAQKLGAAPLEEAYAPAPESGSPNWVPAALVAGGTVLVALGVSVVRPDLAQDAIAKIRKVLKR